jgi:molecular chaperone GrpE
MSEYEDQTQGESQQSPTAQEEEQEQAEQEQATEQPAQPTLEQLQQERDDLEDRLKRVSADYQNYMRRAQQNVTTAQQQQLMEVAKSLVTVLDHFDHALQVDPQTTSPEKMMEGVEMVRSELLRVLQNHGVQRVEAEVGEPFDPNRHEAMMRQPTSEVEPDHVAAQIQPGYALDEKTIRPAKVAVAQPPQDEQGDGDNG